MDQLIQLGEFLTLQDITDVTLNLLCRRLELVTGKRFYSSRVYDTIRIDCNYGTEVKYKRILISGDCYRKEIKLVSYFYNFSGRWDQRETNLVVQELLNLGICKYNKKEHIHILVEDFRSDLEKLEAKAKYITDLLQE